MNREEMLKLAELRFFRDLVDAERMKVFKVFDALPQDFEDRISHAIQRKLFYEIAAALRASAAPEEGMRETCLDCGKREPCDDDCPNHQDWETSALSPDSRKAEPGVWQDTRSIGALVAQLRNASPWLGKLATDAADRIASLEADLANAKATESDLLDCIDEGNAKLAALAPATEDGGIRATVIEECAQAAMSAVAMIPMGQVDASEFLDAVQDEIVATIRALKSSPSPSPSVGTPEMTSAQSKSEAP